MRLWTALGGGLEILGMKALLEDAAISAGDQGDLWRTMSRQRIALVGCLAMLATKDLRVGTGAGVVGMI